ncbi:SEC14-like protein 2 [Ixodes scapularis]
MRSAVADLPGERTDHFLLRWLRARDFDVSKAENMLRRNVEWRSEHKMDSLVEEYQASELVRRFFPGGILECSPNGNPVFLIPIGNVDIRDDYLIVHPKQTPPESVIQAFASRPTGLSFKRKDPSEDGLQYLDLHLKMHPDGICWEFR